MQPDFNRDEHPPRADLRTMLAQSPLPSLSASMISRASLDGNEPTEQAKILLEKFNAALAANDSNAIEACFYPDQAYWRDQLALTYHLRTLSGPAIVAASFLETKNLRELKGDIQIDGDAILVSPSSDLKFIDFSIVFETGNPDATCAGRVILLPVGDEPESPPSWKIWILSTRLEDITSCPEDSSLLRSPGRPLDMGEIETPVVIIGGGNSAIALSARLKAYGVESIMLERNPRPGDNWAHRYENMKFHVPTKYVDLPYLGYEKELLDRWLTKTDLANQVNRYVKTLRLNMINSVQIQESHYDQLLKEWKIRINTPIGSKVLISKHLVMATGIGSQKPRIPQIPDRELYKGFSIHSAEFLNAKDLQSNGVKSVIIVGSANTAFDVLEECVKTDLKTTMNVRSPTLIAPAEQLTAVMEHLDVRTMDKALFSLPSVVDSQLSKRGLSRLALQDPDRYHALREAGFPVIDNSDPDACLSSNLLEMGGGHYVDVGGTKPLETGKAAVKALTEPVSYTETGLKFADGSCVDADAIIWCTGFTDKDVNAVAAEILGGSNTKETDELNDGARRIIGAHEVASRMDATWGLDSEGEVRGVWKRNLHLDNFWVMGGFALHHRWHSRTLAQQIKASLEGKLPPAYLKTLSTAG